MLSYYVKRSKNEGFVKTKVFHEYTTWIHGDAVSQHELDELVKIHKLQPNILRDVRDKNELPHIEYGNDGTVYAFLRVPMIREDHEVTTTPLLLVLTKSRYFTLAYGSTFSPDETIRRLDIDHISRPTHLALLTVAQIVSEYELLMQKTTQAIKDVRRRLRTHEVTNRDFIRFATIEDNLNEYKTNLDGMQVLIQHFHENRRAVFRDDDLEMIDDILLHIKQLIVTSASQSQTVTSIRNAYTTIANNTLNQRMKTLTVFTVLIALPNVFYGMYGMNIALPFADMPWAYPVIVLFTLFLIIAVYILARRSKLF
jgi:magnesium transporter